MIFVSPMQAEYHNKIYSISANIFISAEMYDDDVLYS